MRRRRRVVIVGAAAGLAAALSLAAATLAADLDTAIGRALFRRTWTAAPSSTRANDGLGPLFNARACLACHQGLDRQPVAFDPDGTIISENLALRFSDADGRPDPIYGHQLQTSALPGHEPEGKPARRADGGFEARALSSGALAPGIRTGARLAPQLWGLGALEQVPEEAILAYADRDDRDGDGVSGRPSWLLDPKNPGDPEKRVLGRFGWRAAAVSLEHQAAAAFSLDMGLSSTIDRALWGDCTAHQAACREAPHGGTVDEPEVGQQLMDKLVAYLASLPPPEPVSVQTAQPVSVGAEGAGPRLFAGTGCAACHRPELPSSNGPVRAFTDLLLHDLGPELDGGATDPGVKPTEWRTAPLWGVSRGLAREAGLLHDGRARNVEEAVRLHGGEAAGSRSRFEALDTAERRQLLDYVSGL